MDGRLQQVQPASFSKEDFTHMLTIQNLSPRTIAQLSSLLISAVLLTGCPDSKVEVHRVTREMTASQKRMKGVFYALPRTLVLVKVPISRTDKLPGKYEKFARCFFPEEADRRVTSPGTEFEVSNEITMETKGEPDPNQIFIVNTKAGLFQTKSLLMAYTEDGVLSSAKAETKDESIDFAISTFKTLASLGGSIAKGAIPGGSLFGLKSTRLNVRASGSPRLTPTEYQKEAQALQARTKARKCYNFYVEATAARTRSAAELLKQSLEALRSAGGPAINYQDADVKIAVDAARQATIKNNRAAELADEAIAHATDLVQDQQNNEFQEGTSDTTNGVNETSSNSAKPSKSKGSARARRSTVARKNAAPSATSEDPEDPLVKGKAMELISANRAREVVGDQQRPGLSETARRNVDAVYNQARRALTMVPASPHKEIAAELLKATEKALKGAETTIVEAQEMDYGTTGVELSEFFYAGYHEAAPFAERIFALQHQREQLVIDDPRDMRKETLELMLKEIDTSIKTYKQIYFLGAKKTDTWSATFQYLPPSAESLARRPGQNEEVALFNFSEAGGVCGGEVLAVQGIKVHPDFSIKTKCGKYEPVSLNIQKMRGADGSAAQFADVVEEAEFSNGLGRNQSESRGYYYRIPARARLVVTLGPIASSNEVARAVLPVAQLGVIASLPASAGGRRTSYNITLDPATGALRNFELGADAAIQKSMLAEAETSVQSIIEARDPLDRLKRRKEFLEILKAVKDTEKELEKMEKESNSNGSIP